MMGCDSAACAIYVEEGDAKSRSRRNVKSLPQSPVSVRALAVCHVIVQIGKLRFSSEALCKVALSLPECT
jgi:hypothetical protein